MEVKPGEPAFSKKDPLANAVYLGIKEDINTLLRAERWRGALLLIYAGMDCMASLGMPEEQEDVTRDDFVAWAERYIQFSGQLEVTGLELYAARCGLLHQYGTASRLNREGECRQIIYGEAMNPPVLFKPKISEDVVVVSLQALAEAFFTGIDRYVVDLFKDPKRAAIAERRLERLILVLETTGLEDT